MGFKGPIICTPATKDLCNIMLADSAHIQENDLRFVNKRRIKRGEAPLQPLYTVKDAENCLHQFKCVKYNTPYQVCRGC
jgi:metallo-beta-lactamase family protein